MQTLTFQLSIDSNLLRINTLSRGFKDFHHLPIKSDTKLISRTADCRPGKNVDKGSNEADCRPGIKCRLANIADFQLNRITIFIVGT